MLIVLTVLICLEQLDLNKVEVNLLPEAEINAGIVPPNVDMLKLMSVFRKGKTKARVCF